MDIKEATFEDLKRENPKLIEESQSSVKTELAEAQNKIKTFELKEKQAAQKSKVEVKLKESKLPEAAKKRILASMEGKLFDDEAKLTEAYDKAIKEETDYLNEVSGKGKITLGGSEDKLNTLKESIQEDIEKRLGIKKEKKDETK